MNFMLFLVALGLHLVLGLWLFSFYQPPIAVTYYETISVNTIEEHHVTDLLAKIGNSGSSGNSEILDEGQVIALAELGASQATKLQQDWLQQQQMAQERQQQELAKQAEIKRQEEARVELQRQQEEARKLSELQRKREEERKQAELQRAEAKKQAELQRAEAKKQAEAAEAERKQRAEAATRQRIEAARQSERQQRIAQVIGQVSNRVLSYWQRPANIPSNMACIILINLADNGNVLHAQIVVGSGNAMFDSSAISAVYKAAPFNIPADLLNEFRSFQFNFRPYQ
jgi:colicin import membrane protein